MTQLLEVCKEISSLCQKHEELSWAKTFNFFIYEIEAGSTNSVKKEIKGIFGGVNSFNDLVIQKDGVFIAAENEKLSNLRRILFNRINDLH